MIIEPSKRKAEKFQQENVHLFIRKALFWASRFSHCSYYCPNDLPYLHDPFLHFLAADAVSTLDIDDGNNFNSLQTYHDSKKDWLVGNLGYDLKNEVERLSSTNQDLIKFDSINFFQPRHLIFFSSENIEIHSFDDPKHLFEEIDSVKLPSLAEGINKTSIEAKVHKEKYLQVVNRIREQIIKGEVYELNYCMEFYGNNKLFDPLAAFLKLNNLSPMPFAAFQKIEDKYLVCASPERFLKKNGGKLISQPIKGTIGRGKTSEEDEALKFELQNSEKERAENMMIVDLVRNDLAKSSITGSIKVQELFGIYSYTKVHQMVSTVISEAKAEISFSEIIKNAFPMGSMTGAPKVIAMKIIEEIEDTKRGIFSGAAGYITPQGNFDFNVVIRSLLYNQTSGNLSFQVGSAITYDSVPEKEYEECLLKADALLALMRKK